MTDKERDDLKQEFEDLAGALMDQRNIAQNQLAQLGATIRALQRKVKSLEDKLAEQTPLPLEPKSNGIHADLSH